MTLFFALLVLGLSEKGPLNSIPYLARTAFASSMVVGSGAQGPDAMCVGSSPTTSEMMSATTGAREAAARRPPAIADRCLRTVLISWISAPLLRS